MFEPSFVGMQLQWSTVPIIASMDLVATFLHMHPPHLCMKSASTISSVEKMPMGLETRFFIKVMPRREFIHVHILKVVSQRNRWITSVARLQARASQVIRTLVACPTSGNFQQSPWVLVRSMPFTKHASTVTCTIVELLTRPTHAYGHSVVTVKWMNPNQLLRCALQRMKVLIISRMLLTATFNGSMDRCVETQKLSKNSKHSSVVVDGMLSRLCGAVNGMFFLT